ncbi:hypothetical protein B1R94_25920 [Mycolicibacterium litorale]|nr:hypothetical protein B1R94_25920 [Mycolicibacterium litorale]
MSAFYKDVVKASPGYGNAADQLWEGLRRGISLPLAIIEQLFQNAAHDVTQFFENTEDALTATRDFFTGKWTAVDSAAAAAAYANAQRAAAGRAIVDLFDRPAGPPGANWDVHHFGGGGSARVDGSGHLAWSPFGGLYSLDWMRWLPADTITDYQVISTVMSLRPADPFLGAEAFSYLLGRVNPAIDTFVAGQIRCAGAGVVGYVSGTPTVLASNPVTVGNGDSWDFYVGDAITSDPYKFVLVRNGVPVVTANDTSMVTQYGPGYRSVGLGMQAADRTIFTGQTSPGAMVVFSADDQ